MITEQLLDNFKAISIRGRMAFGIHCLEIALSDWEGYDKSVSRILLDRLYEFVESDQKLNIWDQRITDVAPFAILDEGLSNYLDEYETIDEQQALQLKEVYERLPDDLCKLINTVIYIGLSNLYGGVNGHSPSSLSKVARVIDRMQSLKLPLPDLSRYTISPFTEWGGWGFIRPMTDFGLQSVKL